MSNLKIIKFPNLCYYLMQFTIVRKIRARLEKVASGASFNFTRILIPFIYLGIYSNPTTQMSATNQMLAKFRSRVTDLEPVYGTAVDEGREHPESVPERISDRGHGQDNVEILLDSINEVVVHRQWGGIYLLSLKDFIYILF